MVFKSTVDAGAIASVESGVTSAVDVELVVVVVVSEALVYVIAVGII